MHDGERLFQNGKGRLGRLVRPGVASVPKQSDASVCSVQLCFARALQFLLDRHVGYSNNLITRVFADSERIIGFSSSDGGGRAYRATMWLLATALIPCLVVVSQPQTPPGTVIAHQAAQYQESPVAAPWSLVFPLDDIQQDVKLMVWRAGDSDVIGGSSGPARTEQPDVQLMAWRSEDSKYRAILDSSGDPLRVDDFFAIETPREAAARIARQTMDVAGPAARDAARQAIDAAAPVARDVAKQALDAATPVARQALDAAAPMAKDAARAAAPVAQQALEAATPMMKQGIAAAVDAAVDAGALPAITKGVVAVAPTLTQGVAAAAPVLGKGVLTATCMVTGQGADVRALEDRVAELERKLRLCDKQRQSEELRANAAMARATDLEEYLNARVPRTAFTGR